MKSRKSFLLRINPALYEQLEAWAQQELRSVNGQIEYLLKEAVARRKRSSLKEEAPQPPPAPPLADVADEPIDPQ
jgi:hypothetical protein